jgi:uncharacterized protein (TIGR02001 family)
VSLSDGDPAVQAAVAYDHDSGLYLGLFASTVRLATNRQTGFQTVGQAGYALRGLGGLSWDIGALYSGFSNPSDLGYVDYYVGVASTEWSARLSYAPSYFGQLYSALYAELNVTPRSEHALVPLLHVGWLTANPPPYYGSRSRWDGRFGLGYSHESLTLQLSWVTASRAEGESGGQRKSGWVLRLTAWL